MSEAPELTPFAILLRRYRQAAGLTQEDLAERAHLSARGISDLERGLKHVPRKFTVLALAEALALSDQERAALEAAARATSDPRPAAEPSEAMDRHITDRPSEEPFIFLSCGEADVAILEHLVDDLRAQGIAVWSERTGLHSGALRWEQTRREAIRAAQAVVLLVSRQTRSSRSVADELRIAEMYRRDVQLVWVEGDSWRECVPDRWSAAGFIDARGDRYDQALRNLVAQLTDVRPAGPAAAVPASSPAEPDPQPRNPYKGLQAFTGEDAGDFFGRESLTQILLEAVGRSAGEAPRFLALIGPSGSGKSSLVLAGLLPRLRHGDLPGSASWVYLRPLFPGDHPLEALTVALGNALPGSSLHAIREDLESSPRALHLLAGRMAPAPQTKVVLVVDQCEELFTLTTDEGERRAFIDLLVAATQEPRGTLLVILTLRADFYDRPMSYPNLARLLETHARSVLPMELSDLRRAIERPAALPDVGLRFEESLVGDLLFEVRDQAGALPLLQFTLDQLFARRQGRMLTAAAYEEIGGVRGALAQHAEATYAALADPDHERLARALFLRLVDPGVSEQDTTRRRAAMSELTLPDAQRSASMKTVADTFIRARLLTASDVAGVTTIEVSHEALIREWGRLAAWLREARDDIRLQQALSTDAAQWQRRGEPPDRVYAGTLLDEALVWADRNTPSAAEQRFLEEGLAERERQEALERGQQARELALSRAAALANRRAAHHLRYLVGALAVFLVVASALAALAVNKARIATADAARAELAQRQAQSERTLSLSRQVAAQALAHLDDKPDLALLLSVAANDVSSTVEAKDSLLRTLEHSPRLITFLHGHQGPVLSVAFSHDGRLLVSGGADTTIRRWDATTGRQVGAPLAGHTGNVFSLALSSDGRWLASAGSDATVRLWDLSSAHPSGYVLPDQPASVTNLAFSPIAPLLAYVGNDASIHLWNAATGRPAGQPLSDHRSYVTSVAFSPTGLTLAAGADDGSIQLWDIRQRQPLGARLLGHTGRVTCLSFSPDRMELASGSADKTIRIWRLGGSRPASHVLTGHLESVTDVAFSPDGRSLASSSLDETVWLWNLIGTQPVGEALPGKTGAMNGLAFSPDGKMLAAANADGTIWLWSMASQPSLGRVLVGHTDTVNAVVFSSNGRLLASGGDTTVRLWDVSRMRMRGSPLGTHTTTVSAVAFSPDGQTIASGSDDETVRLWDVQSGRTVRELLGASSDITGLAFSHDGRTIAAATGDGIVRFWDVRDGRLLRQLHAGSGGDGSVCISLSQNGRWLAAGTADGSIVLWDLSSGRQVDLPFAGHSAAVNSVAFSPDSRVLASGSADKTVRLWSVATGRQIVSALNGHTDGVTSVAFSPDGSLLASGSLDNTIRLWDVASGEPVGQPLTGHTDGVTGVAFSPDGRLLASASDDTTIRIWDIGVAAWKLRACRIANRELTSLEWTQYLGNQPQHDVCLQD